MPIPKNTQLTAIPDMLSARIATYNLVGKYNTSYNKFITDRNVGITTDGGLGNWITGDGANAIQTLLEDFGMNARNSELVSHATFQTVLSDIEPAILNWIVEIALPLDVPPPKLVNIAINTTLSDELMLLYNKLATPGSVTKSGGFVAASKTLHCLFPQLAPMIDGSHTGISYYNIDSATYTPPLGLENWAKWVGVPINGKANPSPRGAGRNAWQWYQFMAAIGINQHIFELWQLSNGNPGLQAFLALDPTPGTTGIPRIIDKSLW